MKKKVSIIIPIYNCENYLNICLDSVLKQVYKNIEILCINDGSTDNSLKILKSYSSKDSRIIVINKKNSGVSDTRNFGIKKSTGEYIMFIDADDYIEKDYVKKMVDEAILSKSEMVISGYTKLEKEKKLKISTFSDISNSLDITYPMQLRKYFESYEFNPCWKMLMKSDFIKNKKILFETNLKYGEDMLFSFYCYINSIKTTYLLDYGYIYRINDFGVMKKKNKIAWEKYCYDNKVIFDLIDSKIDNNMHKLLVDKAVKNLNSGIRKIAKESSDINYIEFNKTVKKIIDNYYFYLKEYNIFNNNNCLKENIKIFLLKYRLNFIYYFL